MTKKEPSPFEFVTEKGRAMVEKQNAPNEINNPHPSKTEGGKVVQGPNEGGTDTRPDAKKDPIRNSLEKTDPQSIASPSQEEADDAKSKIIDKEETKDGVVTLTSSVDQGALDKHLEKAGKVPTVINQTEALLGTAGYVNLTQDGHLNSDKSVREDVSIEEQFAELNKITGANPTPLRDGNETTKAANGMTGAGILGIDQNTNFMAADIDKILDKKGPLTEDDRTKLKNMSEQLRTVGRFS